MVSRSNLSNRPGPGGVLGKVLNPPKPRANRTKISAPEDMAAAVNPDVVGTTPGGANADATVNLGQATATAKQQQLAQAGRAVKPRPQPTALVRRADEQAEERRARTARTPGTGFGRRAGMAQMGQSQAELAGEVQPPGGALSRTELMTRAQRTLAEREAEAEAGGTRTENDVTEPTLNRSRRPRSRAGRIYRR